MNMLIIIGLILLCATLLFLTGQSMLQYFVTHRAMAHLEKIYFKDGPKEKQRLLDQIDEITDHRYTNFELTDYFLKIKGLQNFSKDGCNNFWVRQFLNQPTLIKLDYYEQMKFYKAFKSHPKLPKQPSKIAEKETATTHKETTPLQTTSCVD
ncbi:hypothetical protein ACT3CD_04585 [Geofilum sp. OHC36d9]|uniref:hypothetical protein n=1 Tax=Geofilum sp. OHC36d9 TaxID=3458413 RepID=UPI004033B89A